MAKKKNVNLLSQEKRKPQLTRKDVVSFIFAASLSHSVLQKFKRSAKPQVPQNMTVPNYKVKVLILHIAIGSVRRKYYPLG